MNLATEKRDFYKLEVRVEAPTVIIQNLEFKFNYLKMSSEYDESEVIIKDRRVVFEPQRTLEGFRVSLFVLNEGDNPEERIDYLIDEDYQVDELSMEITSSNNQTYSYELNEEIGEQVDGKEVEVELSLEMRTVLNLLTSAVEEDTKEIGNLCYQYLSEDEEAVAIINDIANIDIL